MGVNTITWHQIRNNVFAKIVTRFRFVRIALELLVEERCVEHINAHARQRARRITGDMRRIARLLDKFHHALLGIYRHDAERRGVRERHIQTRDRHVCLKLNMLGDHFAVIHFVDMVPGKNQNELRPVVADDVEILKHRVRRAFVPAFALALLCRQQFDALLELARQETPAALQVL